MRLLIIIISFISLCVGVYLSLQNFTILSLVPLLGGLIVFLTAIANFFDKAKKKGTSGVSQSIGDNSSGIQVGGDFKIDKKD